MKRFTAYRRNIDASTKHTAAMKNCSMDAQFEGVIWSDGTVTLRWLTACRSTSVWNSLHEMLQIHGHPEYGTEITWHDGDEPYEWTRMVALSKMERFIAERDRLLAERAAVKDMAVAWDDLVGANSMSCRLAAIDQEIADLEEPT